MQSRVGGQRAPYLAAAGVEAERGCAQRQNDFPQHRPLNRRIRQDLPNRNALCPPHSRSLNRNAYVLSLSLHFSLHPSNANTALPGTPACGSAVRVCYMPTRDFIPGYSQTCRKKRGTPARRVAIPFSSPFVVVQLLGAALRATFRNKLCHPPN